LIVFAFTIVELHRNRKPRNQLDNRCLRIRHGIQRLAPASTRIKNIEQYEFIFGSALL